MRHARAFSLVLRQLLPLLGLAVAILATTVGPALADGLDSSAAGAVNLPQAVNRALRNYGWQPAAIAYITSHTHVVETQNGLNSPCPTAVACSLRDGSVYLNQVPTDPSTLDYVLNHEFIHAIEFARGSTDASTGPILADVLELSNDAAHPVAADAARRVLGLSGDRDHPVITGQDWFHIEHYILEDVGWDIANLPEWYRDAYFPYLTANPPVRKVVTPSGQPRGTDLGMQRVLDTIVKMCGPVLPGARLSAPSMACNAGPLWAGVPYTRLAGGAAPQPATPSTAAQTTQSPQPPSAQPAVTAAQLQSAAPVAAPAQTAMIASVDALAAPDPVLSVDQDGGPAQAPVSSTDEDDILAAVA